MNPITRARAVPISSSWARRAPTTPAAAAPRRTCCSATRCARRATSGCRSARAGRRGAPSTAPPEDLPENPYIAARHAALGRRAADPLRRRGSGAGAAGPAIAARPCRAGERHPAGAGAEARVRRTCASCWSARPRAGGSPQQIAAARRAGDRQRAGRSARELRAARRHPVQCRPDARRRGRRRDRHDQRRRGAAASGSRPNMPAIWSASAGCRAIPA